jgi:hypothetical protein
MTSQLTLLNEIDEAEIAISLECDPLDLKKHIPMFEKNFTMLSQNIRSIYSNLIELQINIAHMDFEPDLLILSECRLNTSKPIPQLPNYTSISTINNSNQNDGVVIYAKHHLNANFQEILLENASCIQVKCKNQIVLGIYRSPSNRNAINFISSLHKHLETIKSINTIVITGDLNINLLPRQNEQPYENCNRETYLNMLSTHGILPGHLLPTRLGSCLDHVMLKINKKITTAYTAVINTTITDHYMTFLGLNNQTNNITNIKPYETINYESAVTKLLEKNIQLLLFCNDPYYVLDNLTSKMISSLNESKTTKTSSRRNRILKPWITAGVLRCIRNRNKMQLKLRSNPENEAMRTTYRRYRNFTSKLIKKLKRKYDYEQLEKNKSNSKALWTSIKNITNYRTTKSKNTELLTYKSTPYESINHANIFFTDIGNRLAMDIVSKSKNIISGCSTQAEAIPCSSFVLVDTDPQEIANIIDSLKSDSSPGHDRIPSKFFKYCRNDVAPVVSHLANLCFAQGVFPTELKRSLVTPVHKSGNKSDPNNYRPISVLTSISKILEKLINNRLVQYLNKFNLLSNSQFGFRKGKSTEDAILNLTTLISKEVENGKKCLATFLDLKKAFDTVSVPILVKKLERIGIRGKPLGLLSDYLSGRNQKVKIGDYVSEDSVVSFGVPQGSVLGPTLFLVYINELTNIQIQDGHVISYADDTAVIFTAESWDSVHAAAEKGLHKVNNWLTSNLLTLNTDKTNYICFSKIISTQPPPRLNLKIHVCKLDDTLCTCTKLNKVSSTKYLGIIIDERLCWHPHIDYLNNRIRKLIWIFKILRHVASKTLLNQIYISLAQSVMTYCIPVWGGASKMKFLEVERGQRCLLKTMLHKPYRYSTSDLYNECKLLSMRKLYVTYTILKLHKTLPYKTLTETRRRTAKVAPVPPNKSVFAKRQYNVQSAHLYNNANAKIHFYSLRHDICKEVLYEWISKLDYIETEGLLFLGT